MMITYLKLIFSILTLLGKSKEDLLVENLALKQQLPVLKRKNKRIKLSPIDRRFWIFLKARYLKWKDILFFVQPITVVKWHQQLAKKIWKNKSKGPKPGRPKISGEIQKIIVRIANENRNWGAGKVYGELLKLGFEVSERTVARYMPKRNEGGLTWQTFLKNQCSHIVAIDFFTVFTVGFKQVYGLVVIDHKSRKILLMNATSHPTYQWIVQQLVNSFPGDCPYKYLISDNDKKFSSSFESDLKDYFQLCLKQTSFRSPWQNAICERVIGSIRRECLDHMIILNEDHLRSVLSNYSRYYNSHRTHRSLNFGSPMNQIQSLKIASNTKKLVSTKHCNGLHHSYQWIQSA